MYQRGQKTWYKDDSFFLACQAQQVFYMVDSKHGWDWRVVQHRYLWDITETDGVYMNELDESIVVDDTFQNNES